MKRRVVILILGVYACTLLIGQEKESTIEVVADSTFIETDEDIQLFEQVSELDPQRAALLSAMLPGMGQAYNKQYWKVPIIYGGLTAFGHFIDYNNKLYHAFRNAAIADVNGEVNPFEGTASTSDILVRNRDNFRRNRDYLIILGSVFYLLNIVDAHVSAHLDEFNVNDGLGIYFEPSIQQTPMYTQVVGASFVFKF